ncbi:MAG: tRNA lysidine(34) synthetase TilS [Candidatus Omnitrophica bacterium]|nr:tRNA lysidine(34) synthetase TilS [Candidatus Omnitrophota bacterium]
MDFIPQIHQSIVRQKLVAKSCRLVVAVSGGMDSMALLYALYSLKHELGVELIVAHYDHKLRRSSGLDRRFVQEISCFLGLRCVVGINLTKPPKTGSIEEYARKKRYAFLIKTARDSKADFVALAHHEDDLAETVLLRVLRGTGLRGLRSMAPKSLMEGVTLIRPFLDISRQDIERFVKGRKIPFVMDSTNFDTSFDRNKLRLKVIPFIEKEFFRSCQSALAGLARSSIVDYSFLESEAEKAFLRVASERKKSVSINLKDFFSLHQAIQRMVLRRAFEKVRGNLRALGLKNMAEVEDFLAQPSSTGRLELPQGLVVIKKGRGVVVRVNKSFKLQA